MLYCVLGNCQSLREIGMGLAVCEGNLNHLSIEKAPASSTLSDANKNRSSDVFKSIYHHLQAKYKLVLSDSTLPKYETIQQTYKEDSGTEQTLCLRRIAWWNEEQKRVHEFITNNFEVPAKTVADIYRYRWQTCLPAN